MTDAVISIIIRVMEKGTDNGQHGKRKDVERINDVPINVRPTPQDVDMFDNSATPRRDPSSAGPVIFGVILVVVICAVAVGLAMGLAAFFDEDDGGTSLKPGKTYFIFLAKFTGDDAKAQVEREKSYLIDERFVEPGIVKVIEKDGNYNLLLGSFNYEQEVEVNYLYNNLKPRYKDIKVIGRDSE
ncbi:MAG: hypothetical protein U5N86_12570 [Planctomycetota bacterium]|nr:hypothetical protein [Planctomycetota bacterium]